jgi:sulfur carrier protein
MGLIILSGKEIQTESMVTIQQAISANGYHPDAYLYLVDGKPVPMDTVISDGMTVKAVRVASGG